MKLNICKKCKCRLHVINSRQYQGHVYRKRICPNCHKQTYSIETECEPIVYYDALREYEFERKHPIDWRYQNDRNTRQ